MTKKGPKVHFLMFFHFRGHWGPPKMDFSVDLKKLHLTLLAPRVAWSWDENWWFYDLNQINYLSTEEFQKSFFVIDNFKTGNFLIFLHFEKHLPLRNWFFQGKMFFVFWFLHFPCKFKIINGRGSDVIFWENKVKTG